MVNGCNKAGGAILCAARFTEKKTIHNPRESAHCAQRSNRSTRVTGGRIVRRDSHGLIAFLFIEQGGEIRYLDRLCLALVVFFVVVQNQIQAV